MVLTAKQLKEERMNRINQARAISEKAEAEKRNLTSEETEQIRTLGNEAQEFENQADALTTIERLEARNKESMGTLAGGHDEGDNDNQLGNDNATPEQLEERAYHAYLTRGEIRTNLQADSDEGGGYLIPDRIQTEMIKDLSVLVHMRNLARVLPPIKDADRIGLPVLTKGVTKPKWTREIAPLASGDGLKFGLKYLQPQPLRIGYTVSQTLVRKMPNVETLLRTEINEAFAEIQEYGFMYGSGVEEPLGVMVTADDGIPKERNMIGSLDYDTLLKLKFMVDERDRNNAVYYMNSQILLELMMIKDATANYMWVPSVKDGEPDRLWNRPVYTNDWMPDQPTTEQPYILFGNLDEYVIVDALTLSIKRFDDSQYDAQNLFGYHCKLETDGRPRQPKAFARLQAPA